MSKWALTKLGKEPTWTAKQSYIIQKEDPFEQQLQQQRTHIYIYIEREREREREREE